MNRKCDILYIHSTKNPTGDDNLMYGVVPMGIIGILNNLRSKGYEVLGMNFTVEKSLDPDFDIPSAIKDIEYKVLLTDLHWYEHSYGAMYVVEESKKAHPDIPTIIGGYTSTIFSDEIIENFKDVDYIVTGDSDLPMELLIDYLFRRSNVLLESIPNIVYRQGSTVVKSKETWVQTSLDNIDFVHTDFFDHSEIIPFIASQGVNRKLSNQWLCIARGCKFNCSYCCGANKNMKSLFNRCNILLCSPQKVANDFCELTDIGIDQVCPSHDFQMFGDDYYHEIFAAIRESNVKPGIYLECFQLPTKDYIDDLERTFNKEKMLLAISPISGNDKLRKENGKFFTNEEFYEIIEYLLSKGINFKLYYTVNVVGETKNEFMDTYFQMQYLHMKYKLQAKHIAYQRIVIDPLAGMRDFKGAKVEYNTFMDYYNYCLLPFTQKFTTTGFDDGGELPLEEKVEMCETIFRKKK